MQVVAVPPGRRESLHPAVVALSAREFAVEKPRVAIPHAEVQIVVRFGPAARDGLDMHVLGAQQSVRRKHVRGVLRALEARCGLAFAGEVFGVPAAELAGGVIPLAALWGNATTHALRERLAQAGDASQAATVLAEAIARRVAVAGPRDGQALLVAEAVRRLPSERAQDIAVRLDVSERHLRRLFHQTVGMSPKRYERIARFRRAIHAARADAGTTWASIAAAVGYYDQAHLIADFHAIAGTTPGAFLRELGEAI